MLYVEGRVPNALVIVAQKYRQVIFVHVSQYHFAIHIFTSLKWCFPNPDF